MAIDSLIIFQKTYDFILWLYLLVNRIPKHHRIVLGRQLEELGISLLVLVISANKARGEKRTAYQSQISDELDKLRVLLRLTKDLRLMSINQYAYSAEKINEIGKILSGWMRTVPKPVPKDNGVAKTSQNLRLF